MGMAQEWNSVEPIPVLSAADLEAKIHELTALQLLKQLEDLEEPASPGVLNAALRFLKDNDVTALPIPGGAMKRLADKLELPFPRITDAGDEAEQTGSDD